MCLLQLRAGIARHHRIRRFHGAVQIGAGTNNAVELRTELQHRPEELAVQTIVLWCLVHKTHPPRHPIFAQKKAQYRHHRAQGQFDGLPIGGQVMHQQMLLQNRHALGLFQGECQRFVVQAHIGTDELHDVAHGRRIAHHHPQRAQHRESPGSGHAQAKILYPG